MKALISLILLALAAAAPVERKLAVQIDGTKGRVPARKLGLFSNDEKAMRIINLKHSLIDMEAEIEQNQSEFIRGPRADSDPPEPDSRAFPANFRRF